MNAKKIKQIKEYIYKVFEELKREKGLNFDEQQIDNIVNQYISQDRDFEIIKQDIDTTVLEYVSKLKKEQSEIETLRNQLKPVERSDVYFGEVYKTYIIHILNIYEEICNSDLSEEEKRIQFETQLSEYLAKNSTEMLYFIKIKSERVLALAPTELHRGAESLNYDTVKNLYETFINDITIVSNDYEGKMYSTVLNNQKIFAEPILDENGKVRINPNIKYNFDMIKETYDFAKKHGKEIKFHTFLWHDAIPENLKAEIDNMPDPMVKRKMALTFLEHYAFSLALFIQENGYDLRQFEALNEIASDIPGNTILRDSWWKDVIGNNPENGDEYFIDVLKIVKRAFPDTEIIYNEYNEYLGYKVDKITAIIEQIKKVEERDGISLLDGIGLQAHYKDYIQELKRPLTSRDILESATKIQEACGEKGIYITEYDFLDYEKNGNKEKIEQAFIDIYSTISNGFIIWGNSDSLTWYHCVDKNGISRNPQIIDSKGKPKDIYKQFREFFYNKKIGTHYKL